MVKTNDFLDKAFRFYKIYGDLDIIIAEGVRQNFPTTIGYNMRNRASLCLCTEGEAFFKVNEQSFRIYKGNLLIVPPCSEVSALSFSDDFDLSVLAQTSKLESKNYYRKSLSLADLFHFISQKPVLELAEPDVLFFQNAKGLMVQAIASSNEKFKDEILHALSYLLMMWLSGQISNQMQAKPVVRNHHDELVIKFLNLLRDNYKKEHRLEFYAEKLCVTPKYLSVVCRKVTTHSAGKLVMYAIIGEAKRLLLESHLTVSQIAIELGFPNQSSFGKYFKKEIGSSPVVFRQSI